jgi:prophage maintenance system killer protein
MNSDLIIYQNESGAIELKGDFSHETIWATQAQIVDLFKVDQSVVSRHIRNIFKDQEIDPESNMQKMHIADSDKPVSLYSLDVILSVGYRTNSKVAIQFRQWATVTLHQHITQGYTINKTRIQANYSQFMQAVNQIQSLLPAENKIPAGDALELIKMFASTWLSLTSYDSSQLPTNGATLKDVKVTTEELAQALLNLKQDLIQRNEATVLFGAERSPQVLDGIIGNVFQSFSDQDLYPSVEEKAAHLLYFIVKNHPFSDGNKRSGAFAFVWFLQKAGLLDHSSITPQALTALTLLVAESAPHDKAKIIGLIILLLNRSQ